jgi:4-hydroxybenzoate polyprenyltransferase
VLESVLFVECHFPAFFILLAATLYIYATSLQMLLLGNIVVALLLSFSVIIIGIFDLYPVIDQPISRLWQSFSILLLHYLLYD